MVTLTLKESFINAWTGAATLNSYAVNKMRHAMRIFNKNHVQTPREFHDLNMDLFEGGFRSI